MTDLAVACTEARLGVDTQAAPDGETNNAVTVLAANDILAGKHITSAPVSTTRMENNKLNHPSGAVLKAFHGKNVMSFQLPC